MSRIHYSLCVNSRHTFW